MGFRPVAASGGGLELIGEFTAVGGELKTDNIEWEPDDYGVVFVRARLEFSAAAHPRGALRRPDGTYPFNTASVYRSGIQYAPSAGQWTNDVSLVHGNTVTTSTVANIEATIVRKYYRFGSNMGTSGGEAMGIMVANPVSDISGIYYKGNTGVITLVAGSYVQVMGLAAPS